MRTGETNFGNFIADSHIRSYDTYAASVGLRQTRDGVTKVVGIQNGGGIRQNAGDVLPRETTFDGTSYTGVPGPISRRNTLDVMAFLTNSMTVVRDVTPDELKLILERSASTPGGGQFLQIGGMSVEYSLSGEAHVVTNPADEGSLLPYGTITTPGSRVVSVTLGDGTPIVTTDVVSGAPNVSIVTNNFTADGGDNDAALGSIPPERKVNLGLMYEQAVVEYLLSFAEAEGLPTVPASDGRYSDPNGSGRLTITP